MELIWGQEIRQKVLAIKWMCPSDSSLLSKWSGYGNGIADMFGRIN